MINVADETEYILQTRQLSKHFGGVKAITDVDFKLLNGELRCLIGPNGAGKSTFFKMLSAQHAPTSGEIFFKGQNTTKADAFKVSRLGIGIKNQVPDVFDGLDVKENIWLAARFGNSAAMASHIVDEMISRLSLESISHKLVGELAHGERQWVEFGMVSALGPQLLLLDEPTAGMTVDETAKTAELILELNKTISVIVVEHDMQFIREIANIVTVFHQGKILMEDTMENIQQNALVRDIYLGKS